MIHVGADKYSSVSPASPVRRAVEKRLGLKLLMGRVSLLFGCHRVRIRFSRKGVKNMDNVWADYSSRFLEGRSERNSVVCDVIFRVCRHILAKTLLLTRAHRPVRL